MRTEEKQVKLEFDYLIKNTIKLNKKPRFEK